MSDMRHLYGMPKSAAEKKAEFADKLGEYFSKRASIPAAPKPATESAPKKADPNPAVTPEEQLPKRASYRNSDIVAFLLKSAAEKASKCPQCGEKKGQCKCGACKRGKCSRQSIRKVGGGPIGDYVSRRNAAINDEP